MPIMLDDRLQAAIVARLRSDADLQSMITGVYDVPPAAARLPYLVIPDSRSAAFDSKSTTGARVTGQLTLFAEDGGQMPVKEALAKVEAALLKSPLNPVGVSLIMFRMTGSSVLKSYQRGRAVAEGQLTYDALLMATD